jgi:hypothetical protein
MFQIPLGGLNISFFMFDSLERTQESGPYPYLQSHGQHSKYVRSSFQSSRGKLWTSGESKKKKKKRKFIILLKKESKKEDILA